MYLYVALLLILNVGHVISTDCPSGWVVYGSSCYLFPHNRRSTFTEAEHYCRQHQESHLLELESKTENAFIREYLRGLKGEFHWFGLTDETAEGVWEWYSNQQSPAFTDWGRGYPDHSGGQDCALFDYRYDYTWNDGHCNQTYEPICELSRGTDGGEIVG